MDYAEYSPEGLFGPLNEVERKYAPKRLYVGGDTTLLQKGARVAVVGARKATEEGVLRASKLAGILAKRGDVVVSGLAAGIDTAAHRSSLAAGGRTIAVIGTPLDKVYPRENAALQERIMNEHLVVSQFAVGKPVGRHNFPMRNRTMALIADVTVIIESGEKSGSISQGWEALRLGRGLFIARSTAENKELSWPSEMLRYGAQVLTDDALERFFDYLPPRRVWEGDASVPF